MTSEMQAPTGLARRSRRLSDRQTEERMLQAAVAMVHRTGLTVSLDHISLEEVIRDADVSRSAVYRRWPYKDLFFSDLVKQLAKDATTTCSRRPKVAVGSSSSCSAGCPCLTSRPCTTRRDGGPTSPCTRRS